MGLVAYVGSLGSGKTWALCRAAIGLALTRPGIKILLGRFYSTDLRDTTQDEFFRLINQIEESLETKYPGINVESLLGQYKAQINNYIFSNGSVVMFRPLDEAETKYKSLNIGAWGIDEASEVPPECAQMLLARARQTGYPHVGFIVSNPTGLDHWLYEWFVKSPRSGSIIFRTNTSENLDNLPPGYIETLRATYPPDWVRRYLEGDWGELLKGRRPVFPTFDRKINVKETPWYRDLPIHVGIDFGYQSPGVVWTQFDPDNRLLIHRSWYPREITAYELAEGIKRRNDAWFPGARFFYYAGTDGNTRKDTSDKTSAEILGMYSMKPFMKYTHIDRGLTLIRDLLVIRDDGNPGLWVNPFNERIIEGFAGGYYYPPIKVDILNQVKEVPEKTGIYDPLFDALRYVIVNTLSPGAQVPKGLIVSPFGKPSFQMAGSKVRRRISWH